MYVCLLFLYILSSSVKFNSEIFSFLFATCLSVFPRPFQFPLDEVGLQPLVLWYTKKSFTSLHGKCSVIHRSDAPFQFPLDEVGLRPLVLWYTKKSFTSHMENVLLSMEVMLVMLDTCICHYATRLLCIVKLQNDICFEL